MTESELEEQECLSFFQLPLTTPLHMYHSLPILLSELEKEAEKPTYHNYTTRKFLLVTPN